MNRQTAEKMETPPTPLLVKADPASPVLKATGRDGLAIRAGTQFGETLFTEDTPVVMPALEPGADYAVTVVGLEAVARRLVSIPVASSCIGGFHYAPGGNAAARAGGDDMPVINPFSLWDLNFRPACPDPRGMVLAQKPGGPFWCDIYLTGTDHLKAGTSVFGATIADGDDPALDPATGKPFERFDYAAAVAVMKHHGKGLLSFEEFAHAAYGVTERTAARRDPVTTGLDAPRTSRFGLMQATGNLWVWGHDGDPDEPRASLLGGNWFNVGHAGSRGANVATRWPDGSNDDIGARGRSDHLQPV